MFEIYFTPEAEMQMALLEKNLTLAKRFKAVKKALSYLKNNPRHPGLHTHEYTHLSAKHGLKVFEAYTENQTPQAYRIFWRYGPASNQISILAVTAHP